MIGASISQLLGLIARIWLTAALGYFVGKGWISPEDAETLATAILSALGILALTGYAIFRNRLTAVLQRAAEQPEVKVVVADADVANAVPSPKVVPADEVRDLQ